MPPRKQKNQHNSKKTQNNPNTNTNATNQQQQQQQQQQQSVSKSQVVQPQVVRAQVVSVPLEQPPPPQQPQPQHEIEFVPNYKPKPQPLPPPHLSRLQEPPDDEPRLTTKNNKPNPNTTLPSVLLNPDFDPTTTDLPTLLFQAIETHDLNEIAKVLYKRPNLQQFQTIRAKYIGISQNDDFINTPLLHGAIITRNIDIVTEIVNFFKIKNVDYILRKGGETALILAIEQNSLPITKYLIEECNANYNIQIEVQHTYMDSIPTSLLSCIEFDDINILKYLITLPFTNRINEFCTMCIRLCSQGKLHLVKHIITHFKFELYDERVNMGKKMLTYAFQSNNPALLDYILTDLKIKYGQVSSDAPIPIEVGVYFENWAIVQHAITKYKIKPMKLSLCKIISTIKEPTIELIDAFITYGLKIEEKCDKGYTPVLLAAKHGHFDIMKHLITKHKVNIHATRFNYGLMSIAIEAPNCTIEILQYLAQIGVKVERFLFDNIIRQPLPLSIIQYVHDTYFPEFEIEALMHLCGIKSIEIFDYCYNLCTAKNKPTKRDFVEMIESYFKLNNTTMIQHLVTKYNAPLNQISHITGNALHCIINTPELSSLVPFAANAKDLPINQPNPYGQTPLTVLLLTQNIGQNDIRTLVKNGGIINNHFFLAYIRKAMLIRYTPNHLIQRFEALNTILPIDSINSIRSLFGFIAMSGSLTNTYITTHYLLRLFLVRYQVNINTVDFTEENRRTLFLQLATANPVLLQPILTLQPLSQPIDYEISSKDGCSAIILASKRKQENVGIFMQQQLITSTMNMVNNKGRTPMHYLSKSGQLDQQLLQLMLQGGLSINVQDYKHGKTPIMCAVKPHRYKTIQLLVENDADLNIVDNYGATILHYISKFTDTDNTYGWDDNDKDASEVLNQLLNYHVTNGLK